MVLALGTQCEICTRHFFTCMPSGPTKYLHEFDWRHPDVLNFNIKMTKSFTSNTSCFIGARLHVSVFSDHHQVFLWINSKNAGLHIGIPSMFTVCTSILKLHKNYLPITILFSDFNVFIRQIYTLVLIANILGIPICNPAFLELIHKKSWWWSLKTETCSLALIKHDVLDVKLFVILKSLHFIIIIFIIIIIVSCHRPFLPGTSLEPAVIPTAQASSFTLQYFPYYIWCSKYYYYYYYYLLLLSFHSVAAVLALVTNKNKYNETVQKHSKYKYTYYQNTHTYTKPHITKPVKTITVQDTHQMK